MAATSRMSTRLIHDTCGQNEITGFTRSPAKVPIRGGTTDIVIQYPDQDRSVSLMLSRAQIVTVVIVGALAALIVRAPNRVLAILRNVLALSNLALFLFAAAALAWFLYAVILRRMLRARRIANARMRRMMREAGIRGKDQRN